MPGPNPPRSNDWYRISGRASTRWLVVGSAIIVTLLAVILVINLSAPDSPPAPVTTIAP